MALEYEMEHYVQPAVQGARFGFLFDSTAYVGEVAMYVARTVDEIEK